MKEVKKMSEVQYDEFLAAVYDVAPTFGWWKSRSIDRINKPYIEGAKQTDGRILEFGTATGMLTIALARQGFHVTSVDISQYMHETVRKKLKLEDKCVSENVHLINDDVLTYSAEKPFDMIAMPDGLFIAIADQKLQMQLLRNCHRNLRKGGRLYFDLATAITVVANKPEYLFHPGTFTTYSRFRTKNGDLYIMKLDTTTDPITQHCDLDYVFTKIHDDRSEEHQSAHISYRYVHFGELALMLEQSGFKVIKIDLDYFDGIFFFAAAEKI